MEPGIPMFSSEHPVFKFVHNDLPPADALPLGFLRRLETQLIERGIVTAPSGFPLWFLAETERNLFLWRFGLTLKAAQAFDFWAHPRWLIDKRAGTDGDSRSLVGDVHYYSQLLDALTQLQDKTSMVATLGRALSEHMRGTSQPLILLPTPSKR